MKNIIKVLISFLVIATISCTDDILNKEPLDLISDAAVWDDPILIDAYLAYCYDKVGFINDIKYVENVNPEGWVVNGSRSSFSLTTQTTISDECSAGWEWIESGLSYQLKKDNSSFHDYWAYPLVRKLNFFLEQISNTPLEEDYKNARIAEARFLRAFVYFNMVKRYGGVPLITKAQPLDAPDEELFRERDKEEEIYDFILTEIDGFIGNLEDIKFNNGRPTRYAALALKSRAAMYAASIAQNGEVKLDGIVGIPSGRAQEYWNKSYEASSTIINSGTFQLYNQYPGDKVTNYRNIFLDQNNEEVIFSEIYNGNPGKGHSWDLLNRPFGFHTWGQGGQCALYLEMAEAYDYIDGSPGIIDRQKIENGYLWTMDELYGNKDPRFHASVFTNGSPWENDTVWNYKGIITSEGTVIENSYEGIPGWGKSASWRGNATPFTVRKYVDPEVNPSWMNESKTDWIVFRYAEILLNFAEAAYELGKLGEALDAINQIRIRAGIATLGSISREQIRHERRVELAFEAHRYWDVRRWRTAVEDLSVPNSSLRYILDYETRKFKLRILPNHLGSVPPPFLERHYYMPISVGRISNNPNLVENPGY